MWTMMLCALALLTGSYARRRDEEVCTESYCKNGGTCRVETYGIMCQCPEHMLGETCDLDIRTVPDVRLGLGEMFMRSRTPSDVIKTGRLEVLVDGKWGAVCATNETTDRVVGETVCNIFNKREMHGFGRSAVADEVDMDVVLEKLVCNGGEKSIQDCVSNAASKKGNKCEGSRVVFNCADPIYAEPEDDGN